MEWPHWSVYIVLVVAWFWQNCVHERAHLLAIWHYHGKKSRGFYPYPHRYHGRLYFARYKCEPYEWPGHPVVHAAPLLGGLGQVFVVMLFGGPFLVVNYPWHLAVLFAMPVADALWWVCGYFWGSDESDGKRFRVSKLIHMDG